MEHFSILNFQFSMVCFQRECTALALVLAAIQFAAAADLPESSPLPARAKSAGPLFERVPPSQTGIDLVHVFPANGSLALMQEQGAGSGICAGDIDGDGLPDLVFSNYDLGCRLYRNLGNWRFSDITEQAGVRTAGRWCGGVALADIDNDGDLDLYVCCLNAPNLLFINRGDGMLTEKAAEFGLAWVGASVMGAFADYDRDGRLDLYLLTHRDHLSKDQRLPSGTSDAKSRGILRRDNQGRPEVAPQHRELFELIEIGEGRVALAIAGQADQLFHQQSDGAFTNATARAGLQGNDIGLGVSWWDYNHDGWPDIYVANDHKTPDRLWRNNHDGTFTDVARTALPHVPLSSMGTDITDVNNDGRLDLLATDMAGTSHARRMVIDTNPEKYQWFLEHSRQYPRNSLYLSTGTDHVLETAFMAGIAATDWTWSPKFGDLDNDGWVDLFIANGMTRDYVNGDLLARVKQRGHPSWRQESILKEVNLAFRNRGDLHFDRAEIQWGLNQLSASFGASLADLDRDGDLDLVVMNLGEPVSLFRNQESENHRVSIRLKGTRSNRWGVGALVTAATAQGLQTRTVSLTSGFMSANEPLLNFGLGKQGQITRLTVLWPNGVRQHFENLPADRAYTIVEPADSSSSSPNIDPPPAHFRRTLKLSHYIHRERSFDDYAREPLLPWKCSQMGPGLAIADIDGDGDDDFYLGGSAGELGVIGVQERDGQFQQRIPPVFNSDKESEDLGAVFFDADGDGDADLYVVSGGVESSPEGEALQDRLYLNDGRGAFQKAPKGTLPKERDAGSAVCAADMDRDGDLDLFVGGRSVPGQYPLPARSHLYRNDQGKFVEASETLSEEMRTLGVVTAAIWSDVNGDGWIDLVIGQEWGSVRCFLNERGRFRDATIQLGFATRSGLWQAVAAVDVDGDGDMDYVTGNFGANTRYRAAAQYPLRLFRGDFHDLGVTNLIEAYFEGEHLVPLRNRPSLLNFFPPLMEAFPTFQSMAVASLTNVFSSSSLARAYQVSADTLESGVWINEGTHFQFRPLPSLAQLAPTFGVVPLDADGDGRIDLALAQNFFGPNLETLRMDGSLGLILRGQGTGDFVPVWPRESGFIAPVDGRALGLLDLNSDDLPDLLLAANAGQVMAFENLAGTHSASLRPLTLRLQGRPRNPNGVGAKVELKFADGSRRVAEVYAGSGYLSQSSATLYFPNRGSFGPVQITVRWPTGESSTVEKPNSAGKIVVTQK
ncbi:MAG: FG-GAP-like repeat-containing protein [Verrucomicrobiales bacterium]|nr:FG-GAP-like repeat-containing protein [Verrucomicrobiales bacterium]